MENKDELEIVNITLLLLPIISSSAPLSKIPRDINDDLIKSILDYINKYVNIERKKRIQVLNKVLAPDEIFGREDLLFNDLVKNNVNIDSDIIKYYKNDLFYNLSKDSQQLNLGYVVILLTFNENPIVNNEYSQPCKVLKDGRDYDNRHNGMIASIKSMVDGITDISIMDLGSMTDNIRASILEYNKKFAQLKILGILQNKDYNKKQLSTTLIIEDTLLFNKNVIGVVITNNTTGEYIQLYWNTYDKIDIEISKFIEFYIEYGMDTRKLFIKDLLISGREVLDDFLHHNNMFTKINDDQKIDVTTRMH